MIIKNTDKLYVLPDAGPQRAGTEITSEELAELVALSSKLMDESDREEFSIRIQAHVGPDATYALKASVLQGLKVIYDKFKDSETRESEQKIMAVKLQERALECTPGFHNGVNAIVDGFYAAKNLGDLLYRVRQDIASRTANQLTDEVHTNNRVFVVAEEQHYGVHALNKEDIYRGDLSDRDIKEALKTAFKKELSLFPMLQGLEDQLKGQLGSVGYEGTQETGYSRDIFENIEASFKELFKDDAVVQNLEQAKLAMDKQIKEKAALLKNTKQVLNELGLSDNDVNTFLSQSPNLLPMLKNRLQKKIDDLSEDKKTSLESIKSSYLEKLTLFDNQAREELVSTADAFKARFFLTNEEGAATNINWPNLREMIWKGVKEQQYFAFTEQEDVQLDAIMDPDTPDEALTTHLTVILDSMEPHPAIQALNYFHLPEPVLEKALLAYAEKLPSSEKYNFFKAILHSLDCDAIKRNFITAQHMNFIDAFKQDVTVLPLVVPFMTQESLGECLLGEALQDKKLHLAVLKYSTNLKPFIDAMDGHWPDFIKTEAELVKVLSGLNAEQCIAIFEAMKDVLPAIIQTANDIDRVFSLLKPEQRTAVYTSMKKYLPEILKKEGCSFYTIFSRLNRKQRIEICEDMEIDFPSIIKKLSNFSQVYQYLSTEKRTALYENMKDDLPQFIQHARDFTWLSRLNDNQRTEVYHAIKGRLPGLIKDKHDLNAVLEFFNVEQCKVLCEDEDMKEHLSSLMTQPGDLGTVLTELDAEKGRVVCEFIKAQRPSLIEKPDDFGRIFYNIYRFQEPLPAIYKVMTDVFPNIMNTPHDFGTMLPHLSDKKYNTFCEEMKDELLCLVKTGSDFQLLLSPLNIEQRTAVYESIKDDLPKLITTAADFKAVVALLNAEQRTAVYQGVEDKFHSIAQAKGNFLSIFPYLNNEQKKNLLACVEGNLSSIVHTAFDFACVFNALEHDQQIEFLKGMEGRLPSLVQETYDFILIFTRLDKEHRGRFLDEINVLSLIPVGKHFDDIIQWFDWDDIKAIIDRMEDLPSFVHNKDTLCRLLYFFNDEQKDKLLDTRIEERLPSIIQTKQDLEQVLHRLNDNQSDAFCSKLGGVLEQAYLNDNVKLIEFLLEKKVKLTPESIEKIGSSSEKFAKFKNQFQEMMDNEDASKTENTQPNSKNL